MRHAPLADTGQRCPSHGAPGRRMLARARGERDPVCSDFKK